MKKKGTLVLLYLFSLACLITGCAHNGNSAATRTVTATPALQHIMSKGELVVGMTGDMPPLNMTVKSGKVIGLEPELSEYIADAMGVKLKLKTLPFAELLPALQSGQVDMVMSGMTITPKRNLKVAFVGPYFLSGKCILTKEEGLAQADEPSDINRPGVKLAALQSSTSQLFVEELAPKATLVTTKDYDAAVRMVLDNEVDALVGDYPVCVVSLLRYPDDGLMSVISLLTQEPIGIALPANDPLFINWMGNFIDNLQSNGILSELKADWFESGPWLDELP